MKINYISASSGRRTQTTFNDTELLIAHSFAKIHKSADLKSLLTDLMCAQPVPRKGSVKKSVVAFMMQQVDKSIFDKAQNAKAREKQLSLNV